LFRLPDIRWAAAALVLFAAGGIGTSVARETGRERSDAEDDPAEAEDPAGAEEVGEAGAEEQQPAEDDDVGVEDPREVLGGETEVGLHLRQGDADDRRVHDDHGLGEGDESERDPASRCRRCGRR
jgi:hypothetical protein